MLFSSNNTTITQILDVSRFVEFKTLSQHISLLWFWPHNSVDMTKDECISETWDTVAMSFSSCSSFLHGLPFFLDKHKVKNFQFLTRMHRNKQQLCLEWKQHDCRDVIKGYFRYLRLGSIFFSSACFFVNLCVFQQDYRKNYWPDLHDT